MSSGGGAAGYLATVEPTRRVFLTALGTAIGAPQAVLAASRPPPPAVRRLRLDNAHTGESFEGPYRNEDGPIAAAMGDLATFLRDHHSGKIAPIDVAVVDFLSDVLDAVGAVRATVLSAYRTPETNARLARTTFGVAENSQHIYARAIDVHIEGKLERAVAAARAMKRGGVGWYPHSGFIHLDSGPVRTWTLQDTGLRELLLEIERALTPKPGAPSTGPGQLILDTGNTPVLIDAKNSLKIAPQLAPGHHLDRVAGSSHKAGTYLLQGQWTSLGGKG